MPRKPFFYLEKKFEGRFNGEIFGTLYLIYKDHLKKILFLIIIGFLGRIFILANANVIGLWVDSLCVGSSTKECRGIPSFIEGWDHSSFITALLVLSALGFLFILVFRIFFSRMSAKAISILYDEITYRTSRYPLSFFDRTPAGRVLTRFSSDYGNIFRIFGGPMADFIAIIFDLIAIFILVLFNSFYYMPFFLMVFIVNFFIYQKNKKGIRHERRELSRLRSPSIAHFTETAHGAHVIRSFQKESIFVDRFQFLDSLFLNQKLRSIKKVLFYSFQVNFAFSFFYLFILVGAFILLNQGLVGVGSLAVALGFMILASNNFQMFFEWMTQIEEAFTGVERLDEYLRRPLELYQKLPSHALFETEHKKYIKSDEKNILNKPFLSDHLTLELENVTFRYAQDLPVILKNISFKIQAHERVGVVGQTGCGKTSLIQVLFKLYPLDSGSVLINGHDSAELDLNYYRSHFSYIPQDPMVFMDTLKNNLTLGKNISDEKVLQVLFGVGLLPWFEKQKSGLNTFIHERGSNLSIGERQLICMARCILSNAPVVIMDEATSSVDPQSEELLLASMDKYLIKKTQLIIAHRLSTIERCDRILWIKEGRLYQFTSASEVLKELRDDKAHVFI